MIIIKYKIFAWVSAHTYFSQMYLTQIVVDSVRGMKRHKRYTSTVIKLVEEHNYGTEEGKKRKKQITTKHQHNIYFFQVKNENLQFAKWFSMHNIRSINIHVCVYMTPDSIWRRHRLHWLALTHLFECQCVYFWSFKTFDLPYIITAFNKK